MTTLSGSESKRPGEPPQSELDFQFWPRARCELIFVVVAAAAVKSRNSSELPFPSARPGQVPLSEKLTSQSSTPLDAISATRSPLSDSFPEYGPATRRFG